jgi:hypothetical protein
MFLTLIDRKQNEKQGGAVLKYTVLAQFIQPAALIVKTIWNLNFRLG